MKIQTFSIVAGNKACNAKCPFCISKMTPSQGVTLKEPEVNWRNFEISCQLAQQSGATTVVITGKGEPTLFPEQITKYLIALKERFPIRELQTNGILIEEDYKRLNQHLNDWYKNGLTTIAISIAHYDPKKNQQIYLPHKKEYIDLTSLIGHLHKKKVSVRLTCMLADGFICDLESLEQLLTFTQKNQVEQLTIKPIAKPENSEDATIKEWVQQHYLKDEQKTEIENYLSKKGHKLMTLQHGAAVYDVRGQNVCLSDCLSFDPNSGDIRQLIFFPEGHLRYDWQYEGAILI